MNAKNDTTSGQQGHSAKKILLVEDYEGNIVIALHYLEEEGFLVTSALNGEEALQAIEKEDFDLVLMDVEMPIMDGYEATRVIRQRQKKRKLKPFPIIGTTANAFTEDRDKCFEAGMDDYVSKPFDFKYLIDKIRKLT